jgi:tRNA modification GTPase
MTTVTEPTIAACATAGGSISALIRLSGPQATIIATQAGLLLGSPWHLHLGIWSLAGGHCPYRLLLARGPKSFTGYDTIEIIIPGSADLIDRCLNTLIAAGAEMAGPGAFTRQALSNGRLTLDRAEAILAITHAPSAIAATQAVARLRAKLSEELTAVRDRLLYARALTEAGLDFIEEADVRAYDPDTMRRELFDVHQIISRWLTVADSDGGEPFVCLVGPANAGKSALFNVLTGGQALVSPIAGTTRDWLDGTWIINDRPVRVIDTAGWMNNAAGLDAAGIAAGQHIVNAAAIVFACSAPDARLSDTHKLPANTVILATKSDLGDVDERATLQVSATSGYGLDKLAEQVAHALAAVGTDDPRQQRLLRAADAIVTRLADRLPGDELLAEDLRQTAEYLGDLLGITTPDDILHAIFGRFCIGK